MSVDAFDIDVFYADHVWRLLRKTPDKEVQGMSLYALNLFDLADNDLYRQYSRQSVDAVGKHGGRVVALGRLSGVQQGQPGVEPRTAMVLVEWPSHESFQAFLEDPEHVDLHPLRENGTHNYLWWTYERLEDLRPLLTEEAR